MDNSGGDNNDSNCFPFTVSVYGTEAIIVVDFGDGGVDVTVKFYHRYISVNTVPLHIDCLFFC